TWPGRFLTPTGGDGAPGTAVVTSSITTSRAWMTSTANGRPPRSTTHERRAGARSATVSTAAATSALVGSSAGKPAHHRQELVRREGLGQIVVGALALAPRLVALLGLR